MKKLLIAGLLLAGSALPAAATVLAPGTTGLPTQPFSVIAASQGILLDSITASGTARTFAATVRSAVYRNTSGTLDFYYQVTRTGPGTRSSQQIDELTASDFVGFTVDAYASGPDPDGAGFFTMANNPNISPGVPSGSTTTFGRSFDGAVIEIDFGINGLIGTETSATYVLRTNARAYTEGTFGVIDGSTFDGLAFQPAVPEPESWMLLIGGFGLTGFAMRRRAKSVAA